MPRGILLDVAAAVGLLLLGVAATLSFLTYRMVAGEESIVVEQVVEQESSGYEAEWRSGSKTIRVKYVPPEGEDPAVSAQKWADMVDAAEAKFPPNP